MRRHLLDSNTLSQIPWEINVESLLDGQPITDHLQWQNVQQTLQTIDGLRNLNLFDEIVGAFTLVGIADDDGTTATRENLLVRVE